MCSSDLLALVKKDVPKLAAHGVAPTYARLIGQVAELEVHGIHGLSASRLPQVLEMVVDGRLDLSPMISRRLALSDVPQALPAMGRFTSPGVSVVTDLAG